MERRHAQFVPESTRNIWITMCSFFRWANSEFHIESQMKNVPATRFKKVEIEPFTRDEASHMLKACTYSKEADTTYRRRFVMRPATANRDQAIILTLLDSCVRASEFCACRIGDFDAKRGKLEIRHGIQGGAKDGKGRTVYGVANGCLAVREPSFSGEKIAWTGYGSYRP